MTKTCEVILRWAKDEQDIEFCGKPATHRYPAMGGGYMHLCAEHSVPHRKYAEAIAAPPPGGPTP